MDWLAVTLTEGAESGGFALADLILRILAFLVSAAILYWIIRLAVTHALRRYHRETLPDRKATRHAIGAVAQSLQGQQQAGRYYVPTGLPQEPPRGRFDIVDDTEAKPD